MRSAENAVKILGGTLDKAEKFDLSGNTRTIVVIRKEKTTDIIYPRANAKIRKKPL